MLQKSASRWLKVVPVFTLIASLLLAACSEVNLPGAEAQSNTSAQSNDASALNTSSADAQPHETETPEASHTPGASATPDDRATRVPGSEIELRGTVNAISGNTWTVQGMAVIVSSATEVKANIQVGDTVKVHGALQADGSVLAREIEREGLAEATSTPGRNRGQEIEFRGAVSAIGSGAWTVNGITVVITASTEIKGSIQVGDMVKVEGALQADGSVLAREIEREDAAVASPVAGLEIEFTGTLTAINGNVWTVNGLAVMVSASTEIKDTLQVGDTVKVEGTAQADGTVLAREIKLSSDSSGDGSGGDDDHSGSGGDDNDHHDDNSGSGGDDGDHHDDNSGSGGGDDGGHDDDNSGPGGGGGH